MKQKRRIPKAIQGDLDGFYTFLSKMRSPNTLRAYINDLNEFSYYAAENGIKNVQDMDHLIIRKYLGHLSEDHMRSSMNRKLAAVRSFFCFMKKNGVIEADPSRKVRSGKAVQKYPDVLSAREIENIFKLDFGMGKLGLRDKAILEFLYSTGCRVEEAALLDKKDIDLLGETAVVSGKGSRERIVPLGRYAVMCLHEYMKERERLAWGTGVSAVFVTVNGRRVSSRTIFRVVRKYSAMAGISKKVSPHTFRHTFATHMLDAGCNLRIIQDLLGHARLGTTQRYTHLSKKKLKEGYIKFHPKGR